MWLIGGGARIYIQGFEPQTPYLHHRALLSPLETGVLMGLPWVQEPGWSSLWWDFGGATLSLRFNPRLSAHALLIYEVTFS